MIISVIPTWICNRNCNYCFVGNLRKDSAVLNLNVLKNILDTIPDITGFNVFGGEISLLNDDYLISLNQLLKEYTNNITVNTNLSSMKCFDIFDNVSVSINKERVDYQDNIDLLKQIDKPFSISTVVFNNYRDIDKKELLDSYNMKNCINVTFMEYSPIKKHNVLVDNEVYDDFLIDIIKIYNNGNYNYSISNIGDLESCIIHNYNPKMTSNLYINPQGKIGVVIYDKDGYESFKWFDNYNEYQIECINEEFRQEELCNNCIFNGRCYAEHLSPYKCLGHKKLIEWYRSIK